MTNEEILALFASFGIKPEDYGMSEEEFLATDWVKEYAADAGIDLSGIDTSQFDESFEKANDVNQQVSEATTLEELQAIGAENPGHLSIVANRANELGIPLVTHVGGERFAVTDLGAEPDHSYYNYLQNQGLLPDVGGYGYETHRKKDGSYRVSIDEPDPSATNTAFSVAVPLAISYLTGTGLAPVVGTPAATASASGISTAISGGDVEDIATNAAIGYISGMFGDAFMDSGSWQPPDSIAEQLGLPPGSIVNFSDLTPEQIAGVTNPELASHLTTLSASGLPNLPSLLDIKDQYDRVGDFEGPGGKFDVTVLDKPNAPTVSPDAGGSSSGGDTSGGLLADPNNQPAKPSGGLLEQPHIPNDTTGPQPLTQQQKWDAALEEYWEKNPEELQKAVEKNPEAFGGLLGDLNQEDEGKGWRYTGGSIWKNLDTGEKITVAQHPELGTGTTQRGDIQDIPEYSYPETTEEQADMPLTLSPGSIAFPEGISLKAPKLVGGDMIGGGAVYLDGREMDNAGRQAVYDWATSVAGGDPINTGGTGGGTGDGIGDGDGSGQQPDPSYDIDLILGELDKASQQRLANITPYERQQYDTTGYQLPDYGSYGTSQYNGMEGGLIQPMITPAANSGQPSYEEWGMGYGLLGEDERRKQNLGLI